MKRSKQYDNYDSVGMLSHIATDDYVIKTKKPKIINNWKELGFLKGIPEDKEEYMSTVLDYTSKLQGIGSIRKEYKTFSGVEVMYLPLIFRIANETHINETDVNNIFTDIKDNYSAEIARLKSESSNLDLDYEVLFATAYATNKITEYKNK